MPKVTFARDFVWAPKRQIRISYKAGRSYPITSACLSEAEAAGVIAKPRALMLPEHTSDDSR